MAREFLAFSIASHEPLMYIAQRYVCWRIIGIIAAVWSSELDIINLFHNLILFGSIRAHPCLYRRQLFVVYYIVMTDDADLIFLHHSSTEKWQK